ncbi:CD209 antigen-like protein E [Puntigrus tetrazona]|uniref:CD209 antigen-like protein E n=1 Tax=Puntigrus tetrazona TaxID=1606681 RepID=UPI001C899B1F|nr:CD209 antigen-like protein E [Puntigrus tetrazona]
MFRENEKSISCIYENELVTKGKFKEETADRSTMRIQSSELTGHDPVKIRNYRSAVVCLVLLCVLLLTAVIVLCVIFTQERQQLISKTENLIIERDQLGNELHILKWTYYQSSFYYMSSEIKNWTESRRYCTESGADLIIINNREEQDFVNKMFGGTTAWIGLTDGDVEGRWKWVDGSTLTSGYSSWWQGEPHGGTTENCAVTVYNDSRWPTLFGWFDVQCIYGYQWICEKRMS